jgi:hypothetical protein
VLSSSACRWLACRAFVDLLPLCVVLRSLSSLATSVIHALVSSLTRHALLSPTSRCLLDPLSCLPLTAVGRRKGVEGAIEQGGVGLGFRMCKYYDDNTV